MTNRKTILLIARARRAAANILTLAAAASVGAGVMYLYDPNRGRARRRKLIDETSGILHRDEHWFRKHGKDLMNRIQGAVSQTSAALRPEEEVADNVLAERVRSRMGHLIEHPHDVKIDVARGSVVLKGDLSRRDRAILHREIEAIPGVTRIDDRTSHRPFFGPAAILVGIAAGMTLLRKQSVASTARATR